MSESSLPPFGPAKTLFILKLFRLARLMEALQGLYVGRRRIPATTRTSALESRATRYVGEYLDAHAATLERAVRLEEKAERLERAGIPSESARNRARRARGELVSGLSSLRDSFVEEVGEKREGARAFDRAAKLLCPAFTPLPGRASGGALPTRRL